MDLPPDDRVAVRRRDIALLGRRSHRLDDTGASQNDLAKAMDCRLKRSTPSLPRFLEDGQIFMSNNNTSERELRGIALGRKPCCASAASVPRRRATPGCLLSIAKIRGADNDAGNLLLDRTAFNSQSWRLLKRGSSNNSDSRGSPLREKRSRLTARTCSGRWSRWRTCLLLREPRGGIHE